MTDNRFSCYARWLGCGIDPRNGRFDAYLYIFSNDRDATRSFIVQGRRSLSALHDAVLEDIEEAAGKPGAERFDYAELARYWTRFARDYEREELAA